MVRTAPPFDRAEMHKILTDICLEAVTTAAEAARAAAAVLGNGTATGSESRIRRGTRSGSGSGSGIEIVSGKETDETAIARAKGSRIGTETETGIGEPEGTEVFLLDENGAVAAGVADMSAFY